MTSAAVSATVSDRGNSGDPLTAGQIDKFLASGYLVLPRLLPVELLEKLRGEVDHWIDDGLRAESIARSLEGSEHRCPRVLELELGEHGWLISHPPLMAILAQLMGPVFAFHHMHSDRHQAGCPGKDWHHDYEQHPHCNRSHIMVHTFHYLNGLDGMIGDLVLLPGSHNIVIGKKGFNRFGTATLPGEVVIDDLPPGSTVIVHSALMHARRPKPFGGHPRYFIDCSYCQGGVQWPVVKPYWRNILLRARALGLDRGQWHELFSESHFYDPFPNLTTFEELNKGSLLQRLSASECEVSAEPERIPTHLRGAPTSGPHPRRFPVGSAEDHGRGAE